MWWLDIYEEVTRPWVTGWGLMVDTTDLVAEDYGPLCEQIYCTVFYSDKA
jgi:hypothetical protein